MFLRQSGCLSKTRLTKGVAKCHLLPMPYQTHPAFIEPHDRTARLWRYMDLPRLLSVLDKRALFFPSIATLSEADPYEGEPALIPIVRGADETRTLRLKSELFKHLNFF